MAISICYGDKRSSLDIKEHGDVINSRLIHPRVLLSSSCSIMNFHPCTLTQLRIPTRTLDLSRHLQLCESVFIFRVTFNSFSEDVNSNFFVIHFLKRKSNLPILIAMG